MLRRHLHTAFSLCCEPGDLRSVNQDRVLARQGEISGLQAGLFLVADGCGGLCRGEAVSGLLADSFQVIWDRELPALLAACRRPEDVIPDALAQWVDKINESAYAFGRQVGERVGSTLTVLLTLDRRYYILNVGDSRAYLRRGRRLCQLTEDQSLVADMLRNREITPEEAVRFRQKNILTMCVGYFDRVQVFRTQGKLRRGDLFLLCTDGLYHGVGEDRLEASLPELVTEDSAAALRDRIAAGDARDNVSAVLVQIIP